MNGKTHAYIEKIFTNMKDSSRDKGKSMFVVEVLESNKLMCKA